MNKIYPLAVLVLVALVFQVSASVVCSSTNPITQSYLEGSIPDTEFTIATSCLNNGDNSVTSTVASNNNFFSLLEHPITINSNSTKGSLKIKFNQATTQGIYNGFVVIGDLTIPINLNVTKQQTTGCQLNPSLVSYTQTFQQGTQTELPKIFFNPTNCQGDFSITSAFVTGGVTTTSGQKPVYLKSASSNEIVLGVDTKDLSSLTYNTKLTVTAFSKTFSDISTITVIVTGGTNPQGTFNANNLPTCSLTNTILNINSSYSLVCTGLLPDVQIEPVIDNEFIKGTSVDSSSTQFVYQFTPKKFGNTIIKARFKYLGVPVGDEFSQEVKIQSSSGQVPGTELILDFFPKLDVAKNNEEVLIQILDNKSRSLVPDPQIYIDSVLITNKTGSSFRYQFLINKNYSIRAVQTGFNDLVQTISLSSKPINLIISPESGSSNTLFNITTDANATIFVNGETKGTNYFGTLPSGNLEIKAFKEGYIDAIKNITISSLISFSTNPEFKKGEVKIISLDKNSTWNLYYQKSPTDLKELLINGEGNKVEFTPTKTGSYILETPDGSSSIYSISGTNWNKKWWFMAWYWWFISAGLLFGLFYIYKKNTNETSMSGDVNYA